ncbi:MAG: CBS domain-containing protein [Dehalococcoidales bacterium]|nr:CBS domain-containing protein [Dehalococcoidales bacterium]
MNVKEIMTKECYTVNPDTSLLQAAQLMRRHNVGALPVMQDGRLLGIITDRDIAIEAVAAGCDPRRGLVRDFMTAEPVTISPETSLEEAAHVMAQEQVRRLPITRNGQFLGLVSLGDLAVTLHDDKLVADLLRKESEPVRSDVSVAATIDDLERKAS